MKEKKQRTPNDGDWCVCGGVFGSTTGTCPRCGRSRREPENRWKNDGSMVWIPGRGMVPRGTEAEDA